jgi:type IV pilus assembly protein PilA
MRNHKGFSLIELLIVVAIILIIAAIAIPALLRARMSANESAVVGDARTIVSAEVTYSTRAGAAGDLPCLVTPQNCYTALGTEPMLDTNIGSTNVGLDKHGYSRTFVGDGIVTPGGSLRTRNHHATFTYEGTPLAIGMTGQIAYCIDHTGLVCTDPTGSGFCRGATAIVDCPPGQALGQ